MNCGSVWVNAKDSCLGKRQEKIKCESLFSPNIWELLRNNTRIISFDDFAFCPVNLYNNFCREHEKPMNTGKQTKLPVGGNGIGLWQQKQFPSPWGKAASLWEYEFRYTEQHDISRDTFMYLVSFFFFLSLPFFLFLQNLILPKKQIVSFYDPLVLHYKTAGTQFLSDLLQSTVAKLGIRDSHSPTLHCHKN